nr:hypothetical protein [Tanacetum cinerariifolium]
ATLKSLGLGPSAIQATIDETPYIITKDLVRSQLQLADDGGIDDFPIAKIYSGMDNLGTKSGSWDQFGSPLAVALFVYLTGDNLTGLATFLREWLHFKGHPMPLLPAMLLQAQVGEGVGVAAQAFLQHMPSHDQPQDHLSTPPRQQTSNPNALVFEHV